MTTLAKTHAREAGILPSQAIEELLRQGNIVATSAKIPILANQVQPASLDLRLGTIAYRVPCSFLPGKDVSVLQKIKELDGYKVDISNGAVLEKGCVYVIPLRESLALKQKTALMGIANPKSSTGRLDILTRLITDHGTAFDIVPSGYKGPLYIEVVPRTFSIVVRAGARLNQLRFRNSYATISSNEWKQLVNSEQIVCKADKQQAMTDIGRLRVSADLFGDKKNPVIGYRARKHTDRIDLEHINHYNPANFWEPLVYHHDRLILDPNEFYILKTKEVVGIPPHYAAEMTAYDTSVGEFRVHYAGFFDPGFGWDAKSKKVGKSRAVLEVRSHEVPFLLEHGQTVGWLSYEPMTASPSLLYGREIKSNYQHQDLKLAKQFKAFT